MDLLEAVGSAGLVDAAGVVGNFQRMNRIADACGIELDAPARLLTANVRREVGADKFSASDHTKPTGVFARLFASIVVPILARTFSKQK